MDNLRHDKATRERHTPPVVVASLRDHSCAMVVLLVQILGSHSKVEPAAFKLVSFCLLSGIRLRGIPISMAGLSETAVPHQSP